MDNSQRNPQRLSALYQYHNAPEVAPAHGLEYDDTIHSTCSDKYPVVQARHYESAHSGKVFDNDRPPLVIFGMKLRTFLLVATAMLLIIVGAAVGGAVGGKGMRENHAQTGAWPADTDENNSTSTGASSSSSPSSSTYSAPVPTYTPLDSCPDANNSSYISAYAKGRSGPILDTAGLKFTLYCNLESPLGGLSNASTLSESFVYSFSDCVETCGSLNFWAGNAECSVAVYEVNGSRPANCWVGKMNGVKIGDLKESDGVAVAMLSGLKVMDGSSA